jgi:hypothetical protein
VTLTEALADPARQERIVTDCVRLVDEQVASKGGLSGMALRKGYSVFQKVRPGIVRSAVTKLLPEMVPILDRHWREGLDSGDAPRHFKTHATAIADGLLSVTDRIAERSTNRVLVGLYRSLRPAAREHVAAAVPSIPAVIRSHVPG